MRIIKMRQKYEVSKCCWKNGLIRGCHKSSICKTAMSAKHDQVKYNKTRYACKCFCKCMTSIVGSADIGLGVAPESINVCILISESTP